MGSTNRKKLKKSDKAAASSAHEPKPAAGGDSDTGASNSNAATPQDSQYLFQRVKPSLSRGVLKYLESKNFHTMTPVQSASIPLFLTNKDVAVQAVTGSGKTLAFLVPIVEMILRRTVLLTKRQIAAVVLSPTRELARQTYNVACELCKYTSLAEPLLLVGGGSAYRPVLEDLRTFQKKGCDIVIGTPGRVEDVLTRYDVIDVSELECLVLDEADILLDMGFDVTLNTILAKLPKMRRTGLFSATGTGGKGTSGAGSRGIKELVRRAGMRNPVWVNVAIAAHETCEQPSSAREPQEKSTSHHDVQEETSLARAQDQATPTSLTNYYIVSPLDEKLSRLVAFLRSHRDEKIIVFVLTCACVEFYGAALQNLLDEHYIELLHGKMVQKRREKAMERFRDTTNSADESLAVCRGNGGVLLCTDVAARGVDVTDVNWVVQFDAPQDPASFVHRVGRSARAGKIGHSLLFLTEKEESYIDLLRNRKVPLHSLSESENCAPLANPEAKPQAKLMVESEGNDLAGSRVIMSGKDANSTLPDVLPEIRSMVLEDRDLLEKGTKAFTSYIRAYKEHHCAFIFRFPSLDLGLLATSFCLLRLPKMPELRDKTGKLNFKPAGAEINIHGIAFKDKVREKARQKRLAVELAAGGKNAKQIKAEQRQAERIQKQKERRKAEIDKGRNPKKKRGRQQQIFDEWDELAKEERLYKKLRSGKLSREKFDKLMYGETGKTEASDSSDEK